MWLRLGLFMLLITAPMPLSPVSVAYASSERPSRPPIEWNTVAWQVTSGVGITLAAGFFAAMVARGMTDYAGAFLVMGIAGFGGSYAASSTICNIGSDENITGSRGLTYLATVVGVVGASFAYELLQTNQYRNRKETRALLISIPIPAVLGTLGFQMTRRYSHPPTSSFGIEADRNLLVSQPPSSGMLPHRRSTRWMLDIVNVTF
jgi:hypothetical protein